MTNSIVTLSKSAESAGIVDWEKYYSRSSSERYSVEQSLRDPLRRCTFRSYHIVSVYGLHVEDGKPSLIYLWNDRLLSLKWSSHTADPYFRNSLQFGLILGEVHNLKPSMKTVHSIMGERLSNIVLSEGDSLLDLNVYWKSFGKLTLACIYREKRSISDADSNSMISSSALSECLSFHLDYFSWKSPIWNAAPMSYLFRLVNNNIDMLVKLHYHPKCFQPHKDGSVGSFLWPWQKCIRKSSQLSSPVTYQSIETTSLVFDLRMSTTAMSQIRRSDLGAFSPFIKSVVETAKASVFRYGGFFDKETGDGIVAHFVSFEELGSTEPCDSPDVRAFNASMEIIRQVGKLCDRLQEQMTFGVSNLGAAVGLHTGDAVWVSEDSQVRAIGESVILASRLCSECSSRAVFISNSQYVRLFSKIDPEVSAAFVRKEYFGKESRSDAGMYGFMFRMEGVI